ncbi:hypothetical protein K32_26870 [Kaistia sp. 32K]|uniref:hypothetical protein n=1 Tax=Kaistia sp. 32K TaxID=2795690 RepID=UPI00191622DA|nr:hypothetical protein [Kaistia sp. 32K]BCP54070.1 hypothetical protein K32_26870 [Kaistia sp. 32K]
MAVTTQFIVQPFRLNKRGKLEAEPAIAATSAENAKMRAEKLSTSRAGVIAFQIAADTEMGDYGEPVTLVRYGTLPEDMES